MRLAGVVLIGLAACYGPSVVPGAPCDPVINNCPAGQTCLPDGLDFSCGGGGTVIDAATDADLDADLDAPDAALDPDGDGIASANDNCPTVANANQHDEDADTVGDVCDNCPVSSNNADVDGDGLGTDCDPRPFMGGDTLVLFEPFAQGTIPAGWVATSAAGPTAWTVANDELRIASGIGVLSGMRTNIPATSRMMAATSVVADQMFAPLASVGVTNPYATAVSGGGILCSLFENGGARQLSIYDIAGATTIDTHPYAWVDDVPYILASIRDGTDYRCLSIGSGMTTPPQGTSAATVTGPLVGLRSDQATARFQWLLIVQSP